MYKLLIRPILFLFPPERAHHISVFLFKAICLVPGIDYLFQIYSKGFNPSLKYYKKGILFPNRVGLAAGFDKNAHFYKSFRHSGFGFIEISEVTPLDQPLKFKITR